MKNKNNRTRRRWDQEFKEVKDDLYDSFEDVYPEYFNEKTKILNNIEDRIKNTDLDLNNIDEFIKLANNYNNAINTDSKQSDTTRTNNTVRKFNQTFLIDILPPVLTYTRDLLLIILIIKLLTKL